MDTGPPHYKWTTDSVRHANRLAEKRGFRSGKDFMARHLINTLQANGMLAVVHREKAIELAQKITNPLGDEVGDE